MKTADVVSFLVTEGRYRAVDAQLSVADVEFSFDGVLLGPGDEGGLILVVDANESSPARIRRRVSAFSRVLSRSDSRRPLATVLLNFQDQDTQLVEALESVCRVLHVTEGDALEITLRRVLPLKIPEDPIAPSEAADEALRARAEDTPRAGFTEAIIEAAAVEGEKGVEALVRSRVRELATAVLDEDS